MGMKQKDLTKEDRNKLNMGKATKINREREDKEARIDGEEKDGEA